jgi:hypothetical protein
VSLTFDFILKNWEGPFPIRGEFHEMSRAEFVDGLEQYLENKEKVIFGSDIKDMGRWIVQVLVALEVACVMDGGRFAEKKRYWTEAVDRPHHVDLKEVAVYWTS